MDGGMQLGDSCIYSASAGMCGLIYMERYWIGLGGCHWGAEHVVGATPTDCLHQLIPVHMRELS